MNAELQEILVGREPGVLPENLEEMGPVTPGEKTLADCRDEVRLAVLKQGFGRIVARARPAASVEYSLPKGGAGFQVNAGLQIMGGT